MKKLDLGDLKISKNKITRLELYCTEKAKKVLEGNENLVEYLNYFDKVTGIFIGHEDEKFIPSSLAKILIERTEFYGLKEESPTDVKEDFLYPYMIATGIKSIIDYEQVNMIGSLDPPEFFLVVEPRKAFEFTKELRNFFPDEMIKSFNSYFKIPT